MASGEQLGGPPGRKVTLPRGELGGYGGGWCAVARSMASGGGEAPVASIARLKRTGRGGAHSGHTLRPQDLHGA